MFVLGIRRWASLCSVCVFSSSVMSNSSQPLELYPARLLCSWNSPGKNTGVGYHALLQGIFPIQGSNPGIPHCRQILYQLSYPGSPILYIVVCIYVRSHLPIHIPSSLSPWYPYICSLCLCLYFCFANKLIYIISLDSTYK